MLGAQRLCALYRKKSCTWQQADVKSKVRAVATLSTGLLHLPCTGNCPEDSKRDRDLHVASFSLRWINFEQALFRNIYCLPTALYRSLVLVRNPCKQIWCYAILPITRYYTRSLLLLVILLSEIYDDIETHINPRCEEIWVLSMSFYVYNKNNEKIMSEFYIFIKVSF